MGRYENRVVVKVGTSTLMNDLGKTDLSNTERIVRILSDISNLGYQVILVSSGAIAFGVNKLRYSEQIGSLSLRRKQAAAAVGQCSLLFLYERFFSSYDKTIAQILLTADDITHEQKKKNLIKTFDSLLEEGVIPIVNANDSVDIDEIETSDRLFGDNDMLSAVVSSICRAGKLIILSDIDALYLGDPKKDASAEKLEVILDILPDYSAYTAVRSSKRSGHSISTKLCAARFASSAGTDTYLLGGRNPDEIYDIIKGKKAGILFPGKI